jgi:phosphate transport system protein
MVVRSNFLRQLQLLENDLLRLAELVETQVVDAVRALQTHDIVLANRVDEFDSAINKLRYEIEEQAYTMLALQQPTAGDMRLIVAAVSIATNLERMGDHAAGIARLAKRMEDVPEVVHVPAFTEMANRAADNLRRAMDAFSKRDEQTVRAIVDEDDVIDQMHKDIYEMLLKTMINNSTTVEQGTMLLWVSHNLERYADRVSNICERINYSVTGELYRSRKA